MSVFRPLQKIFKSFIDTLALRVAKELEYREGKYIHISNQQFERAMSDLELKLLQAEKNVKTAISVASQHFTDSLADLKKQLADGASRDTLLSVISGLEDDATAIANIGTPIIPTVGDQTTDLPGPTPGGNLPPADNTTKTSDGTGVISTPVEDTGGTESVANNADTGEDVAG